MVIFIRKLALLSASRFRKMCDESWEFFTAVRPEDARRTLYGRRPAEKPDAG